MEQAIQSMTRLNRLAADVVAELGIRGCTDVTGFGLLGHGSEMVLQSGCGMRFSADAVPLLPGAMEYAERGLFAGGLGRNRKYLTGLSGLALQTAPHVPPALADLLFDSETSGGLLFSTSPQQAQAVRDRFAAGGEAVWEIGEVIPDPAIQVI